MACPERELLESEVKQAVKRWTDLEDKATAAIRDADPHYNEFMAHANRARAAAKKVQAALDDHVASHRCVFCGT
jgi:capsid protein